jgi:hypothetical protein
MGRMVRKQVYITKEQDKLLKRRAKALGVSEAEVVRQGIGLASTSSAGFPLDRKAWQELKRGMEKRARMKVSQTGRSWTREELYDERLVRFSR